MMTVTLTPKAKQRLRELEVGDDRFLRIGVANGGCSGMTYTANIETALKDGDEIVHNDDSLRVIADARSALFLDGLNIDYSDDLIQAGFRLSNKNAKKACGCGASFAV